MDTVAPKRGLLSDCSEKTPEMQRKRDHVFVATVTLNTDIIVPIPDRGRSWTYLLLDRKSREILATMESISWAQAGTPRVGYVSSRNSRQFVAQPWTRCSIRPPNMSELKNL